MFRLLALPTRRFYHSSSFQLKKVVETVPALGESITEGTIAKWVSKEGTVVKPDDVVVVVETDKVTVDIKANYHGVITQLLAGETVEVGKPLYEIDVSDGTPVVTKSEVPATTAQSNTVSSSSSASHGSKRVPLIKFIGKRSKTPVTDAPKQPVAAPTPVSSQPKPTLKPSTGIEFTELAGQAWYGRPKLSQKEIDSISSGGAY